jgi:hypothetical protein
VEQFAMLRKYFLAEALQPSQNLIDRHRWTFCNRIDARFYSISDQERAISDKPAVRIFGRVPRSPPAGLTAPAAAQSSVVHEL